MISLRASNFLPVASPWPAGLLLAGLLLTTGQLSAAEPAGGSSGSAPTVAATVGDESVYLAEVAQVLEDAQRGKPAAPASPKLQAEALEQVINRRLVAHVLTDEGYKSAPEEIAALLAELKQRLETQQLSFEEFLKRHDLTPALVERQLAWESAWNRYLDQQMTDAALEKYFDAHRREFDGTELRVSHILLKVENLDDAAAVAATVKRAEQLRGEIISGKLTFAAAAEKYSSGPSRRQGGDLGLIPRHGAMAEAFSAAAFQLQPGETSPPVVTPFGVHLIHCTEVNQGDKTWQSQRRELARSWSRDHFLQLAATARKRTVIKYAGVSPHFKPGTQDVVMPKAGK